MSRNTIKFEKLEKVICKNCILVETFDENGFQNYMCGHNSNNMYCTTEVWNEAQTCDNFINSNDLFEEQRNIED